MIYFDIEFNNNDMSFDVDMKEKNESFCLDFGNIQTVTKAYDKYYYGDYEVTPKVTSQTLQTKDKLMSDDVVVKEIPFFETSNNAGGNTIYIGKEI